MSLNCKTVLPSTCRNDAAWLPHVTCHVRIQSPPDSPKLYVGVSSLPFQGASNRVFVRLRVERCWLRVALVIRFHMATILFRVFFSSPTSLAHAYCYTPISHSGASRVSISGGKMLQKAYIQCADIIIISDLVEEHFGTETIDSFTH